MIHLLFKLLFVGIIVTFALLVLVHVFPFILGALALIGLIKLYQLFRGPKCPPPARW